MKTGYFRTSLLAIVGAFALTVAACNPVTGTYTGANGAMSLELKSNGGATFTMMGQASDCTWSQEGNQIRVTCEGDTTVFTRQKDGSLVPPPGARIEPLKKK
jgi:hypothetical protein